MVRMVRSLADRIFQLWKEPQDVLRRAALPREGRGRPLREGLQVRLQLRDRLVAREGEELHVPPG